MKEEKRREERRGVCVFEREKKRERREREKGERKKESEGRGERCKREREKGEREAERERVPSSRAAGFFPVGFFARYCLEHAPFSWTPHL